MREILISIQPKWCELIANGKKTVEIRKTRPKIETPFKCYIYCTSIARVNLDEYANIFRATSGRIDEWHGKVIGEFVCDSIVDCRDINMDCTCLTVAEWLRYTKGHKGIVWGWHISDLVIYDKPKVLSEFTKYSETDIRPCQLGKGCEYDGYDYSENCEICTIDYDGEKCPYIRMQRPPQSWCYVEGGEQ